MIPKKKTPGPKPGRHLAKSVVKHRAIHRDRQRRLMLRQRAIRGREITAFARRVLEPIPELLEWALKVQPAAARG